MTNGMTRSGNVGQGSNGLYDRKHADFYPTPSRPIGAIEALNAKILLWPNNSKGTIWEPAAGDGDLAERIKKLGYNVVATELHDRGYGKTGRDFLKEKRLLAPVICTNPPFSLFQEFAEHAKSLGSYRTILFGRTLMLEGQKRSAMYERTGLSKIFVFRRRLNGAPPDIDFKSQGGQISYSWFVWDKGHTGPPTLEWI